MALKTGMCVTFRHFLEAMLIVRLHFLHIWTGAARETSGLKGGGARSVDSAFTFGSDCLKALKTTVFFEVVSSTKNLVLFCFTALIQVILNTTKIKSDFRFYLYTPNILQYNITKTVHVYMYY